MELASLIEDLGKACGLELTLDEGRCTLRFDGEHDVTIERDGNAVILHGIAGDGGCLSNPDNLRILINGMKTSGKKRDNLGSIGKSFRRGCNSIAESATKKEGNQPSFFVGG